MDARAMIAKQGGTIVQQVAGHRLQPVGRKGNTWVGYDGTNVYLVLHNTHIVRVNPEGDVRLSTGGWRKATTKRRINQALEALGIPGRVYQEDFEWYHGAEPFVDGKIVGRVER